MTTTAHYLGRIERALALIERSIGAESWPDVAALAIEAAMSPYSGLSAQRK